MIGVALILLALGYQLVVTEKVLNRLFFPAELILENLDLGFKFDVVLFNLVIKNFHLDRFFI